MKLVSVLVPLGVAAAVSFGLASSSARRETPPTTNEVTIRPGDSGCVVGSLEGAEMTEVREIVMPKLGVEDRRATTAEIRGALLERYGSRVSENAMPMHYVWYWDKNIEQWVLVCTGASEFRVDFGEHGSVVVESRDTELRGPHAD